MALGSAGRDGQARRPAKAGRRRIWVRCASNRSGATAVEFGLLAFPFFLIVCAVLETSLVFLGELTLHHGVASVSRDIRVGTIRSGQEALFRSRLYDRVGYLPTCNRLKFDVRTYPSFAAVPASTEGRDGRFDPSGFRFAPGGSARSASFGSTTSDRS